MPDSHLEEEVMKSPIFLIPMLAAAMLALSLAGCGGTEVVKETKETTVVEKPTVTKEIVVEPPTVTREIVVEPPTREIVVEKPVPGLRSCTYLSTTYSHGSISCQNGYQFRCNDGTWDGRDAAC
jgi:hypothetical protein